MARRKLQQDGQPAAGADAQATTAESGAETQAAAPAPKKKGRKVDGRKDGEGTYDEQRPGLYRFRATYQGPDGRIRSKAITATSEKVLRAKVKAWQAELARGLPAADENPRFETIVDQWLATKVDLSPNSVRDYGQTAARIKKGVGGYRVKALTDAHLQAWVNAERKTGRAASTLTKTKAILHQILTYAEQRGYVTRNVVRLVNVPKKEQMDPTVYDRAQVQRLLEVARAPRDPELKGRLPSDWYCLLAVHCMTGLRPSELLGLKWSDIRWNESVIYAQRSLSWPGGTKGPKLAPMKNAYSRRQIPVPSWVLDALQEHRASQDALKAALREGYDDWDLVFAKSDGTRAGGPLREQMAARAFEQLRRSADLPPMRWYNVRHSYATMLLDAGVPLHLASGLLGHASVKITADIYGARAKRNTDAASGYISRLFGGDAPAATPALALSTGAA